METDTLLQFAGRLHPLLLHLPIGLWLGIAVLEFGGAMVRRAPGRATLSILTWIAALGGAFAAGSGWLLATQGYDAKAIDLHRWLGVAAAGIGLLAACFSPLQARGPFRLLLSIEFVVLMAAGHLGSEVTHGKEWLFEPFEGKGKPTTTAGNPSAPADGQAVVPTFPADAPRTEPQTAAPTGSTPAIATPSGKADFESVVQPILKTYCTQCHGATKQKGDLAMHDRASLEQGGENGPVFVAGKPEESPMLSALLLPIDHDDHMPPEGKKQPTAQEIEVLQAWIANGAPFAGGASRDAGTAQPTFPRDEKPAAKPPSEQAPSEVPHREPAPSPSPSTPVPEPTPAPEPAPVPEPQRPGGSEPQAQPSAEPAPARARALAALEKRQVHAAAIAEGVDGLCIDFGPIAASTTADEVRTLLQPVATHVEDLGLSRVPVDDKLLLAVAALPNLRRLDLRSTRTTTDWLRPLARTAKLDELVLASTRLDDRAVDVLLQLPALRTVYVWDSGLSPAAVARLRERAGLKVDFGDEPARTAMPDEAPSAEPAKAKLEPTAGAPAASPLAPCNALCPVSQKPVDARYVVLHEQKLVGFCCPNCPKSFWQEPAKYPVADR